MKIIGIEEKIGEYQGSSYHNLYFYCTEALKSEKSAGSEVSSVKVKYDTLIVSLGKAHTIAEIFGFVGKDVEFYYNEFLNVKFANIATTTKENTDTKA